MLSEIINTIYKTEIETHNFIVGIDFGPTYSYFTFASKNFSAPNDSNSRLCKEDYKCFLKEYSAVYYNTKLKYRSKFGKRALLENSSKPKGDLFQYFQPLLYRKFDSIIDDQKFEKMENQEIIDITANYLYKLVKAGLSRVKPEFHAPYLFWKSDIRYVITTPTICSEQEKTLLKRAVIKAGITSPKYIDKQVMFISVNQASAFYYEQYLHNHFKKSIPQYFMVCNTDGRTTHVSIFNTVESTKSNTGPLLNEIITCTKTECRSDAISEKFDYLLNKKIKECEINGGSQRDMEDIYDEFINDIVPAFSFESEKDIYFSVPYSFGLPSFFKDPTNFIENDTMRISHNDLSTIVFQPVSEEIVNFITNQLDRLPVVERRLDAILLVGNFGQSPYLYRKVMDEFERKDTGANVVLQLPQGEFAACKGAASYGMYPRLLS